MSYGIDLRERVIKCANAGGSNAEAARRFSDSRGRVWLTLAKDQLKPGKLWPKQARNY